MERQRIGTSSLFAWSGIPRYQEEIAIGTLLIIDALRKIADYICCAEEK